MKTTRRKLYVYKRRVKEESCQRGKSLMGQREDGFYLFLCTMWLLRSLYSFTFKITNSSSHLSTFSVTISLASTINQCPTNSKGISCNLGMNLYDFWMSDCVHVGSAVPQKKRTGKSERRLDGSLAANPG
jgi:hypothetical protein